MDMAERSKTRSQQEKLDWRKCLFCQKVTNEKLQCPCNNKRAADIGAGYRTLADNLQGFAELGEINLPYDLKELDDGSGVPQYLEKNKACWHKSCHLKYSTEKLSRARKRHKPDENVAGGCKFTRRSAPIEQPTDCFFCGGVEAGELRKASTMGLDARVRECALSLQDQALLGKLSAGDMVAQDAVYHPKCLATLYKKANKILESAPPQTKSESIAHSIALAELVSYIEDKKDDNVSPVFKLANLSELYNERLKQLGVHSCVHTTRLKNRIMAQFAYLQSYTEGRHVYLAFQEDVAVAVKLAYTDQCDDDALCLAKAAKIIRRDIMQCKNTFDGSFEPDCQEKSVPKSVLSLVSMVLEGPNIKQQTDNPVSQASLTISQLLVHNSRTHAQKASSYTRHSKDHETPLPIYVGVNIHGKTRKRELIDDMFRLGLSVSYDRVLSISSDLANKVCAHFHAIGGADLEEFFSHENQVYPPSLSDHGQLRPSTNKSDILDVLPNTTKQGTSPEASTVILDGAAIVHFLQPGTSGTFENYRAQVFYPYLMNQLRHATRVDLVWDQYRDDSLKTRTRANRGRGTRMKVTPSGKIPGNWQEFLKPSENKQELFDFLTEGLHHLDMPVGKHVYATSGPSSICIAGPECGIEEPVPDCSHEEADTRIFVHLSHAVKHGHTSIIIRTVDSDVVVLAVSVAAKLPVQIWLAFGTGKKFRYFPAHECAQLLGKSRSMALPFFHAFTGCDTVSSFSSVGKKTAWTTWEMYDEVTQAFNDLSCLQLPPSDENIALLERFVVLLYDRTSNQVTVNSARLYLFTKKLRQIENIPPTKGSLLQHINRTVFQAGYIWNQTTEPSPNLPSPAEYGWYQDDAGAWQPVWSLLPDAASVCTGLKKCSCRTDCERRCTCKRLRLTCTALCQCNSECSWTQGGIQPLLSCDQSTYDIM